mgnify:CR=1 FL=1
MVSAGDVEGLLCAGVECRRDSAGLQRNGGKEDECGGEKERRRSGKVFLNRKNLWKTLRMKGNDLGVSVKKSGECDENWQMPKKDEQFDDRMEALAPTAMEVSLELFFPRQQPGERGPKNSFACDDTRRKGCLELCIAGSAVWNVLYVSHSALRWRF